MTHCVNESKGDKGEDNDVEDIASGSDSSEEDDPQPGDRTTLVISR